VRTLGLALLLAVPASFGCDAKQEDGNADKAAGKTNEAGGDSEQANKAREEAKGIRARLDEGEDIKYACAGNIAQYAGLEKGSDSDKEAYDELLAVCFVDGPKKIIADLRAKMKANKLGSTDTVSLTTVLKNDKFPKTGDAATVAADAKKLLEIEIPIHGLNEHLAAAKKEKEEGKKVSMGCIKAKQVVTKSGEALKGDDAGKAALEAFAAACPAK